MSAVAMQRSETVTESTVLYAFSADPITFGHIDIVQRMAACFAKCIVAIGRNPAKSYLFDLEERRRLAELSLSHLSNVEVMTFEGMVVDFAFEHGARIIIKGVRSAADMEYEQVLHQVGASQELGIDTHILFADPRLAHVSSSVVKGMQMEHGFIQAYVPPVVKAALEMKLSNQLIVGLTGSIAAGKSTLATELVSTGRERDIQEHNIDLDILSHQILAGEGIGKPMHQALITELTSRFGQEILVDGIVNRAMIAERIFHKEEERQSLNDIMGKPMSILLRRVLKNKQGIILLNGALLPDLGLLGLCNYRCVLCEVADSEQHFRLQGRGLSEEQILSRRCSQMSGREKKNAIVQAIKREGFGRLWQYGQSHKKQDGNSSASLLQQIINDCEECQWNL